MKEELLQEIWEKFADHNIIDERLDSIIATSWRECRDRGLHPKSEWSLEKRLDQNVFQSILDANKELMDAAVPIMEHVNEVVGNSQFLMFLTDSVGYVLKVVGSIENDSRPDHVKLVEGTLWDATSVGTNSVSLVLENDRPVQIQGAEHFRPVYHKRMCCGAPIHGHGGELTGTISFAGPIRETDLHTLALTVSMAFSIEMMLARAYETHLVRASMEGSDENVVLLDSNLNLLYLNSNAKELLLLKKRKKLNFLDIMPNVDWDKVKSCLYGEILTFEQTKIDLLNQSGYCNVAISTSINMGSRVYTLNIKMQEQLIQSANLLLGNQALYSFEDIFIENQLMKKTVFQAQKFAVYDANILLQGELGTGKDLFAQAIHRASGRSNAPFITIDCFSSPRKQIDMELFGKKQRTNEKGQYISKFQLANGGTLFISEVDRMPLELQQQFLRQLEIMETRAVVEGSKPKLDVRIMVGTSLDLHQECLKGRFLYALYLKISALKLNIPALRHRSEDITLGAKLFLKRLNERHPEQEKEISDEYLDSLLAYSWPGNTRELEACIERSFYKANGNIITNEDLTWDTEKNHFQDLQRLADEKNKILETLHRNGGDVEYTYSELGVSRATFYRLCTKHGIEPKKIKSYHKK